MENNKKNKLLIWLVLLLVIAIASSIAMFWLSKPKQTITQQQRERPAEFLIRTLQLDAKQQEQLEVLRAEHKDAVVALRNQLQAAKKSFFALIKQPGVTDSTKQIAAKSVSVVTEKIDLITLNHFIKVRTICNATQQIKFDEIIEQVTDMISKASEAPPNDKNQPPPDNYKEGNNLPPPSEKDENKPPPPQN